MLAWKLLYQLFETTDWNGSVYVLIILFPIWNGIVRNEKTACLLVFVLFTLTNGKLDLDSISHFSFGLQIGFEILFAYVGGAESPLNLIGQTGLSSVWP